MTANYDIQRTPSSLTITHDWREKGTIFLLVFAVFWNSICLVFLFVAGWVVLFHLAVGLLVGYYVLTRYRNTTTITVGSQELAIEHGPLPWFTKEHRIPTRALRQLFARKAAGRKKVAGKVVPQYDLIARLDTDAEVTVISRVDDREMVGAFERVIEHFLNITDEPEVGRIDSNAIELDLQKLRGILPGKWVDTIQAAAEQHAEEMGEVVVKKNGRPEQSKRAGTPVMAPQNVSGTPEDREMEYRGKRYRIIRSVGIEWQAPAGATARQLSLLYPSTGEAVQLYVRQQPDIHAQHFEERRLDASEAELLGFTGQDHPLLFNNGEDRYYPDERQVGTRTGGSGGMESVEQYFYYSSRDTTQFRALLPRGGRWEVFVQESVES